MVLKSNTQRAAESLPYETSVEKDIIPLLHYSQHSVKQVIYIPKTTLRYILYDDFIIELQKEPVF